MDTGDEDGVSMATNAYSHWPSTLPATLGDLIVKEARGITVDAIRVCITIIDADLITS